MATATLGRELDKAVRKIERRRAAVQATRERLASKITSLKKQEIALAESLSRFDRERDKAIAKVLNAHDIAIVPQAKPERSKPANGTKKRTTRKAKKSTTRKSKSNGRRTAEQVEAARSAALAFIQKAKEPVRAGEIKKSVPNIATSDLRVLVNAKQVKMTGAKATARYSAK